eukprot:m.106317 g.106317  ORF g.106317 m.106317 type:complete len:382 (-) comp13900_c0_seq8:3600-4745(-)
MASEIALTIQQDLLEINQIWSDVETWANSSRAKIDSVCNQARQLKSPVKPVKAAQPHVLEEQFLGEDDSPHNKHLAKIDEAIARATKITELRLHKAPSSLRKTEASSKLKTVTARPSKREGVKNKKAEISDRETREEDVTPPWWESLKFPSQARTLVDKVHKLQCVLQATVTKKEEPNIKEQEALLEIEALTHYLKSIPQREWEILERGDPTLKSHLLIQHKFRCLGQEIIKCMPTLQPGPQRPMPMQSHVDHINKRLRALAEDDVLHQRDVLGIPECWYPCKTANEFNTLTNRVLGSSQLLRYRNEKELHKLDELRHKIQLQLVSIEIERVIGSMLEKLERIEFDYGNSETAPCLSLVIRKLQKLRDANGPDTVLLSVPD